MAKKSSIEKNNRRKRMTKNAAPKRERLKAMAETNDGFAIAEKDLELRGAGYHVETVGQRAYPTPALDLPQEQAQPHRAA